MSSRLVKYKDREWFEKNAYKDDEDDWWISEEEYVKWDDVDAEDTKTDFISDFYVGKIEVLNSSYDDKWEEDPLAWGIDFTITKETHPEYYL